MRTFGVTVIFLLLALGGMGYVQNYVSQSLQEVLQSMKAVEAAIYAEEKQAAQEAYSVCVKKYATIFDRLTMFINHDALTEARLKFGVLGVCITDGAWSEARVSYTEARLILKDIVESERLALRNIF